jgi:peptide/nickel transport system substrate-binding protein
VCFAAHNLKGKEMKMRQTPSKRILFVSCICLFFLIGFNNVFAVEKDVLVFGTGIDVATTDPHNWRTAPDLIAISLLYEGLCTMDVKLNVVPALATSWEILNDTTWRFNLRKNVTFHDGTPFNANAAKINIERMREAPRSRNFFGMIEDVKIENDYTIILKTKTPFAPFLKNLCHPVGTFISPKALETYGKDIGLHPVGTGKFIIKEWQPKLKMVLQRNDNYWGQKPKLREFVLRPIPEEGTRTMAFESHEIDLVNDPAPHKIVEFRNKKNVKVILEPAARTVWLGYNLKDQTLSNVALRKAIAHAINREELVKYVTEGLSLNADAWIPNIVQPINTKMNYEFNPELSKTLLKEAGYPNGIDLNLWTPEGRYLKDRQIAEAIQAQLSNVGIRTKLRVMEWGAYYDALFRSEHQLYIWGWAFQVGDPDAMLRDNFYSKSSYNCTSYKSQPFDSALDEAVTILDPQKRIAKYYEIEKILMQDVVGIPIYHKLNIYALWDNVRAFQPHPLEVLNLDLTTVE